MCLAKAYVRPEAGQAAAGTGDLLMENVTQVLVEGDELRLKSLFGDSEVLLGRIVSVDFAEGKLVLQATGA
jgi:predicted RNA-binding protein